MGGEAMAIHASVEEADAIIDQIIGTVTIVIWTFTRFLNLSFTEMKFSVKFLLIF